MITLQSGEKGPFFAEIHGGMGGNRYRGVPEREDSVKRIFIETVSPQSIIEITRVTQRIVLEFPFSITGFVFVLVEPSYKRLPFRSSHQLRFLSNLLPPSCPPLFFVTLCRGGVGFVCRDSLPPDWSERGTTRHPKATASVRELEVVVDAGRRLIYRMQWRHIVSGGSDETIRKIPVKINEKGRESDRIFFHILSLSRERERNQQFSLTF